MAPAFTRDLKIPTAHEPSHSEKHTQQTIWVNLHYKPPWLGYFSACEGQGRIQTSVLGGGIRPSLLKM